ncbi:MAG: hypothetical protein ACI9XU_000491 [Arenicella sp.]|jgi:hypothetical protein
MHFAKFTYVSELKVILLLGLAICSPMAITSVEAQTIQLKRLGQNFKIKRSNGSRIEKLKNLNCNNCSAEATNEKSEYLKRVMTEHASNEYQRTVESQIFADTEFVNGCWKDAIDKGMEFFFTVAETGVATDFAWFPKERAGKCIKRHISTIGFPQLEKPHHSWLLVTGQEY